MVTVDAVERRVGQFFLVWNALVVWNILTQSLHYRLRNAYGPAKARGGGVCILVNVRWATDVKIVSKNCSADIENFHNYLSAFLHAQGVFKYNYDCRVKLTQAPL